MDENYENPDLRSKLIVAGLKEIEAHGVTDFSLRRVAADCNVSCAAPYRHFKNKDTLILEIIKFVISRWSLLEEQIESVFSDDKAKLITEMSIALIRFRLANPEFRAVLSMDRNSFDKEQKKYLSTITDKLLAHCAEYYSALDKDTAKKKIYILQSLIYGTVLLADDDSVKNLDDTLLLARICIEELL